LGYAITIHGTQCMAYSKLVIDLSRKYLKADNYDHADDSIIPEDVILCEKQELLFCRRHALKALLQNAEIFDDTYLISV
ncbi:unnamed protein product, partial [Rotaria sordida]